MYYKQISHLPKQIQKSLPPSTQQEYLKVFNCAWEQYKGDVSVSGNGEQEKVAHRIAWESVIRGYGFEVQLSR